MFTKYLEHLDRRQRSPHTIRLRKHYVGSFAATVPDLADVTHDDFTRWLADHPDWSPATVYVAVVSVSSFYKWCATRRLIDDDPTADLTRPVVPETERPIAADDDLVRALGTATTSDRVLLRLGAEGGLRISEIATLHRDNRQGQWLRFIGKGGKRRRVGLGPELLADLIEIEQTTMRDGYYFPGRYRGHINRSTLYKSVRRLVDLNPHALRHRAATVVYRQGGKDIRLTQEFLGHSNPQTTAKYLHVELDDLWMASSLTRLAA